MAKVTEVVVQSTSYTVQIGGAFVKIGSPSATVVVEEGDGPADLAKKVAAVHAYLNKLVAKEVARVEDAYESAGRNILDAILGGLDEEE